MPCERRAEGRGGRATCDPKVVSLGTAGTDAVASPSADAVSGAAGSGLASDEGVISMVNVELPGAIDIIKRRTAAVAPIGHGVFCGRGEQQGLDHSRGIRGAGCIIGNQFLIERGGGAGNHRSGPARRILRCRTRCHDVGLPPPRSVQCGKALGVPPIITTNRYGVVGLAKQLGMYRRVCILVVKPDRANKSIAIDREIKPTTNLRVGGGTAT